MDQGAGTTECEECGEEVVVCLVVEELRSLGVEEFSCLGVEAQHHPDVTAHNSQLTSLFPLATGHAVIFAYFILQTSYSNLKTGHAVIFFSSDSKLKLKLSNPQTISNLSPSRLSAPSLSLAPSLPRYLPGIP